jgi:hypothetical protein
VLCPWRSNTILYVGAILIPFHIETINVPRMNPSQEGSLQGDVSINHF